MARDNGMDTAEIAVSCAAWRERAFIISGGVSERRSSISAWKLESY